MRTFIEQNYFELLTVLAFLTLFKAMTLVYNLMGYYDFNNLMR